MPAVQADGASVRTAASLANGGLDPVQEAFLDAGAVQCGYCIPGFVVTVADLLERDPHPSEHALREALSGNLCRCTGLPQDLRRRAARRVEAARDGRDAPARPRRRERAQDRRRPEDDR